MRRTSSVLFWAQMKSNFECYALSQHALPEKVRVLGEDDMSLWDSWIVKHKEQEYSVLCMFSLQELHANQAVVKANKGP